jgi:LPS sulfotransferase NodH
MTYDKTCIICTPRSGSQLCETLIQRIQNDPHINLGEYFEKWNQSEYLIINNQVKSIVKKDKRSDYGIDDNYESRLSTLENINQNITLRLFCLFSYDIKKMQFIIEQLITQGFNFVILSRNNKKQQVLSWLIARSYTDHYSKNVFGANSIIDKPVEIDLKLYNNTIVNFMLTYRYWDSIIEVLMNKITPKKVIYETIYEDLSNYYGKTFDRIGNKTVVGNHLDYIINKDEVAEYLDKIIT